MSFYASYPVTGGGGGVPTYVNFAAFPSAVGAGNGALAIALDTDILYISNGTIWEKLADPAVSPGAITALTGDGTATGPGSVPLTLATVNGNVGSFGTASNVGAFTVNGKGLITAAANTAIQITESQVTNLVTDLAAKQSTTLTSAHLLVGNVSNVATDVAVSGDLTLANTGSFTFNTVNSNVGSFGTASSTGTFTVNAKGLVTAASNTAIQITESQVTNLVTDLAAKQSTTLTNTHILVGNVSNVATDVAMSGDITIANTGATTIANLAVTNAKIANTTIDLTTKVTGVLPTANGGTGQNSTATFPTSGVVVTEAATETLTNKTINGSNNTITNVSLTTGVTGTLPLLNGGTGTAAASANAAFNALSPLTTKGDIVAYSTVNARLPVGANGLFLSADSSQTTGLAWAAAGTTLSINTVTNANYTVLTSDGYGQILFSTGNTNRTCTLPAAASSTGRILYIGKTDSGTGIVTVDANASETINGALTYVVASQYDHVTIVCDGTTWNVVVDGTDVAARYFASSTTVNGTLATINWTTKDFDTHSGMSSGTYTIPIAGFYEVDTAVAISGTYALNNNIHLAILKTGTIVADEFLIAGGAMVTASVSLSNLISCVAGDTISIQVSSNATGPAFEASNTRNFVSIIRSSR